MQKGSGNDHPSSSACPNECGGSVFLSPIPDAGLRTLASLSPSELNAVCEDLETGRVRLDSFLDKLLSYQSEEELIKDIPIFGNAFAECAEGSSSSLGTLPDVTQLVEYLNTLISNAGQVKRVLDAALGSSSVSKGEAPTGLDLLKMAAAAAQSKLNSLKKQPLKVWVVKEPPLLWRNDHTSTLHEKMLEEVPRNSLQLHEARRRKARLVKAISQKLLTRSKEEHPSSVAGVKARAMHSRAVAAAVVRFWKVLESVVGKRAEAERVTQMQEWRRNKQMDLVNRAAVFSNKLISALEQTKPAAASVPAAPASREGSKKRRKSVSSDSSSVGTSSKKRKTEEGSASIKEEVKTEMTDEDDEDEEEVSDSGWQQQEAEDRELLQAMEDEMSTSSSSVSSSGDEQVVGGGVTISHHPRRRQTTSTTRRERKKAMELELLKEEASMSIEELVQRYKLSTNGHKYNSQHNVKHTSGSPTDMTDHPPPEEEAGGPERPSSSSLEVSKPSKKRKRVVLVDDSSSSEDARTTDRPEGGGAPPPPSQQPTPPNRQQHTNRVKKDPSSDGTTSTPPPPPPPVQDEKPTTTTIPDPNVPSLLHANLRPYQKEGLSWLTALHDCCINGVLADEMGLGKTIQTIALFAHLAAVKGIWGPHLVVVPTSVILNWELELKKFAPGLKVLTYYGTKKERERKRMGWNKPFCFHVCIVSYTIVITDAHVFKRKSWYYMVLDEAQNIRNFQSLRWQTLLQFNSERRLMLTGTPLQNNLMELWSLMYLLMPSVFGVHTDWKDLFSDPLSSAIEKSTVKEEISVIQNLYQILRPFMLRRLKRDVESQMPLKIEYTIRCMLTKKQRTLYEEFLRMSESSLKSAEYIGLMNILMQLRKVCNHPDLFQDPCVDSPWFEDAIYIECVVPQMCLLSVDRRDSLFDSVTTIRPCKSLLTFSTTDCHIPLSSDTTPSPVKTNCTGAASDDEDSLVALARTLYEPFIRSISQQKSSSSPDDSPGGGGVGDFQYPAAGLAQVPPPSTANNKHASALLAAYSSPSIQVSKSAGPITLEKTTGWSPSQDLWVRSQVASLHHVYGKPTYKQLSAPFGTKQQQINTKWLGLKRVLSPWVVSFIINECRASPNCWEPPPSGKNKESLIESVHDIEPPEEDNAGEWLDRRLQHRCLVPNRQLGHSYVNPYRYKYWNIRDTFHDCDVDRWDFDQGNSELTVPEFVGKYCRSSRDWFNYPTLLCSELLPIRWDSVFPELRERFTAVIGCKSKNVIPCPQSRRGFSGPGGQLYVDRHADVSELWGTRLFRMMSSASVCWGMRTQAVFPDREAIERTCGKLMELTKILEKCGAEQKKCVIFTQMSRMLDMLECYLNHRGINYLRLDGTTKPDIRQLVIEAFNSDPRYPALITSTRAGGTGVNLTGASVVIFYDTDWNPATDRQAMDRCHRLGQTKDVEIFRLICAGTIEENIWRRQLQKRQLDDIVVDQGDFNTTELIFKKSEVKDIIFSAAHSTDDLYIPRILHDNKADRDGVADGVPQSVQKRPPPSSVYDEETRETAEALLHVEDIEDQVAFNSFKSEMSAELQEFRKEFSSSEINTPGTITSGDSSTVVERPATEEDTAAVASSMGTTTHQPSSTAVSFTEDDVVGGEDAIVGVDALETGGGFSSASSPGGAASAEGRPLSLTMCTLKVGPQEMRVLPVIEYGVDFLEKSCPSRSREVEMMRFLSSPVNINSNS